MLAARGSRAGRRLPRSCDMVVANFPGDAAGFDRRPIRADDARPRRGRADELSRRPLFPDPRNGTMRQPIMPLIGGERGPQTWRKKAGQHEIGRAHAATRCLESLHHTTSRTPTVAPLHRHNGDYLDRRPVGLEVRPSIRVPASSHPPCAVNIPRNSVLENVAPMLHGMLGTDWDGEEIRGTREYAVARRETTKGPRVAGLLG
jgi:hypothetical protein